MRCQVVKERGTGRKEIIEKGMKTGRRSEQEVGQEQATRKKENNIPKEGEKWSHVIKKVGN